VTFGYKTGAAAVFLLLDGKAGVTVVNVDGDQIFYEDTSEAIKRREVDLKEIALYESLGTCFGRKIEKYAYAFVEVKDRICRHM
jgi:6-phosphofructokinase 1